MKNELSILEEIAPAKLDELESVMLKLPQADCPVRHHFADGLYIRELFMPAGIVAVGHHQKFPVMNVMIQGRVSMLKEDGSVVELKAPQTFVGQPGRKIGYIHEDVIWQNIYPNPGNERDIETLEARWLEKSGVFQATATQQKWLQWQSKAEDREDYQRLLSELSATEEEVRQVVENEADQIDWPQTSRLTVTVRLSPIEGRGLFATANIEAGMVIAPARTGGMRTPAGRYTNHSANPNAEMVALENGDILLRAIKPIFGCRGGMDGDEITINYRHALVEGMKYNRLTSNKELVAPAAEQMAPTAS